MTLRSELRSTLPEVTTWKNLEASESSVIVWCLPRMSTIDALTVTNIMVLGLLNLLHLS